MINFINISKHYKDKVIIRKLNFTVSKGECLALFGPSGCGKTTTLRLLAGFEKPDQGEIWLNQTRVSTSDKMVNPWNRSVGMIFQDLALWPHMSVYEHLNYAMGKSLKKKEKQKKIHDILSLLGIQGFLKAYPLQMSGGEKQRLAIARTLITEPDIILFDEPLSNLDSMLKQHLLKEIKALLQKIKITSIYVTHDWQEAVFLADKVAVMSKGEIERFYSNGALDTINKPSSHGVIPFYIPDIIDISEKPLRKNKNVRKNF